MPSTLVRHRFTVQKYEQMCESGIISQDMHVELIHGEVVQMSPVGYRHIACVNRLTHLLVTRCGNRAIVSIQNPFLMIDSEPEPDVALFVPRPDFYGTAKASSDDILLVIEVADTTLDTDRDVKRPLYAGEKIREYWIVNIDEERLEVYRRPEFGDYQDVTKFAAGEEVEPLSLPGVRLSVSEVF